MRSIKFYCDSKTGKAIIVFDTQAFLNIFGKTRTEIHLGGRHHIYLHELKQFFNQLRKCGATLVFFRKVVIRPNKNEHWCRMRNAEFQNDYQIIKPTSGSQCTGSKRSYECKWFSKIAFKIIEDHDYGTIIKSMQDDCEAAIAKYAALNNAMAVVAFDSDYLIFEGNSQWWDIDSIRMEQMRAYCFERTKLRQDVFRLTDEQMKYLAIIGGNNHMKDILRGSISM